MADGKLNFDTAINNKGLEKDLAKQKKIIEQSLKKIEGLDLKKTGLEQSLENSEQKVKDLQNAYSDLESKMRESKDLGYDTAAIEKEMEQVDRAASVAYENSEKIRENIDGVNRAIELENTHISEATERAAGLSGALQEARAATEEVPENISAAADSADELEKNTEAAKEESQELEESTENVAKNVNHGSNAMQHFYKRVVGLAKRVFVFSVITKALRGLKTYMAEAVKKNKEFNTSLAQMRGAWQVAFQPLVQMVLPYLIKLVNFLTRVGYVVAALIAKLTGKSLADLKASTKAANENAKAVNNQVKAYKQLASFDEMDVLQSNTSGSTESAAEETPSATYDFDTSEIESKLDEIETIAGAASLAIGLLLTLFGHWAIGIPLMAAGAAMLIDAANTEGSGLNQWIQEHLEEVTAGLVIAGAVAIALGLILALSGVNIPLGIGLIALGAAALYEAAELNGGLEKFISDNKDKIAAILVAVGATAIVLGAILAFAGHIALGIGLIALGAAAIYGADKMSGGLGQLLEEYKSQIATILMVGGIALLVLGIILTFAGHLPLGIGLLAAGAAAIWGAGKLDWEGIKRKISDNKDKITKILTIGGAALILIGMLLAFTGIALPLGIGILAAGAGMLFGAAALNWDRIKKEITANKTKITKVLTIGGAALIVLGAILALTGVALPLGIGIMAAGAAMLFSAAALNWDTIKTKIRNALATIAAIAGGAQVAIGAILCLTGAGIPLGIALLISGMGLVHKAVEWSEGNNPIVNAVKNVCNGILGFVEGLINKIISGINWMVDQVNKVSFKVPDWVPSIGGKYFGFNLSHVNDVYIPRLAEGAVIPANREFLAVLGDQKRGTNIETPLDTMIEAFRSALQEYDGGDVTIPIYLDGHQIARHVININQKRQFAMNGGN